MPGGPQVGGADFTFRQAAAGIRVSRVIVGIRGLVLTQPKAWAKAPSRSGPAIVGPLDRLWRPATWRAGHGGFPGRPPPWGGLGPHGPAPPFGEPDSRQSWRGAPMRHVGRPNPGAGPGRLREEGGGGSLAQTSSGGGLWCGPWSLRLPVPPVREIKKRGVASSLPPLLRGLALLRRRPWPVAPRVEGGPLSPGQPPVCPGVQHAQHHPPLHVRRPARRAPGPSLVDDGPEEPLVLLLGHPSPQGHLPMAPVPVQEEVIEGAVPVAPWGNLCTARALRATFRLYSPQRAPKHTPWKRP